MTTLARLFQAITPFLPSQHDREESYLAAAVDIYDLERRMREVDQQHTLLPLGLGLR